MESGLGSVCGDGEELGDDDGTPEECAVQHGESDCLEGNGRAGFHML